MRMTFITLAVGVVALGFRVYLGRVYEADEDLQSFYRGMISADFNSAYNSISAAIELCPNNGRYFGWRGYCRSQRLPSQCFRSTESARPQIREATRVSAKDAVDDYLQAIRLNSRDGVAHHNLAWL